MNKRNRSILFAFLNAGSGSNLLRKFGAVAQLGERVVRNDEATGSNPVCSTNFAEGEIDPEQAKKSDE